MNTMFYILCIILIIDFAKSQIVANFTVNQNWTATLGTSKNITIQVTSLQKKYCYVRIELYSKDPSFLLMADYKVNPNPQLISTYKQGEKIDRISQLENRRTRFLKLKGKAGIIFISTMANNPNNQYQLIITDNDEEQCDNQCFQNGICLIDGCTCFSSFIGNDCHQQSENLVLNSSTNIDLFNNETIKFFSIDLSSYFEYTLKLDFEAVCLNNLTIVIYKTKALLTPDEATNNSYTQLFYISCGQSKIQAKIPNILPPSQQILSFAVFKQQSNNQILKFQIKCNYDPQSNDQEGDQLLEIIIPSSAGPIVFIILIGCAIKKCQSSRNRVAQDSNLFSRQNVNEIDQNLNTQPYRNEIGFLYFPDQRNQQQNRNEIGPSLNSQQQRNMLNYFQVEQNCNSQQNRNNIFLNVNFQQTRIENTYNYNSQQNRNNVSLDLNSQQNRNEIAYRNNISLDLNSQQNSNSQQNRTLLNFKKNSNEIALGAQALQVITTKNECIICLEDIKNSKQSLVKINCGHQFHRQCIQQWYQQQVSERPRQSSDCPVCRKTINKKEIF